MWRVFEMEMCDYRQSDWLNLGLRTQPPVSAVFEEPRSLFVPQNLEGQVGPRNIWLADLVF